MPCCLAMARQRSSRVGLSAAATDQDKQERIRAAAPNAYFFIRDSYTYEPTSIIASRRHELGMYPSRALSVDHRFPRCTRPAARQSSDYAAEPNADLIAPAGARLFFLCWRGF